MPSLRLDPELHSRIRRAAAAEGASVSEFLRRAAAERAERTLASEPNSERLGDVIGAVHGGGGRAADTGTAFAELLEEDRRRG